MSVGGNPVRPHAEDEADATAGDCFATVPDRGENAQVMHGELFQPTIPFGEPLLSRASAFLRYLDESAAESMPDGVSTRLSQLSPSLQADLLRFEQDGGGSETIEVIAACIRHSKRVTIHLQCIDRVVPLTVFPQERLVHCPLSMAELTERHVPTMRVLQVEPALLRPPGDPLLALVGDAQLHYPLQPLVWALAMRGPRRDLLPEIAGPAVYRIAPALHAAGLPPSGALRAAIERLRRQPASLNEIASWPALDRERASRMLNALYLQAGLMVSRSHPDAVRDSWFGGA